MLKYINIIQYAYEHHLSQPYTNKTVIFDWSMLLPNGTILPRFNHALAHTLRVCSYIPYVIETFQELTPDQNTYQFSKDEIEKLQLAMIFAVTGRENDGGISDVGIEDYTRFRQNSSEHFETCFSETFKELFTAEEIQYYKNLLLTRGSAIEHDPRDAVVTIAHNMDHVRCYQEDQMKNSLCGRIQRIFGRNFETQENRLLQHACRSALATGDRLHYPNYHPYDLALFAKCNTDTRYCLDAISKITFKKTIDRLPEVTTEEPIKSTFNDNPTAHLTISTSRAPSIVNLFKRFIFRKDCPKTTSRQVRKPRFHH